MGRLLRRPNAAAVAISFVGRRWPETFTQVAHAATTPGMASITFSMTAYVQPHLSVTWAHAILKNAGGRFTAWQNLSTD
jgi:hypothetical protein